MEEKLKEIERHLEMLWGHYALIAEYEAKISELRDLVEEVKAKGAQEARILFQDPDLTLEAMTRVRNKPDFFEVVNDPRLFLQFAADVIRRSKAEKDGPAPTIEEAWREATRKFQMEDMVILDDSEDPED